MDDSIETLPLENNENTSIPKKKKLKKVKRTAPREDAPRESSSLITREPIVIKDGEEINSSILQSHLVSEDKLLLEIERDKFNNYASKKSVSQGLFNTSIIQAHIGLLVTIFSTGANLNGFAISTIVLISASIALQIVIMFMIGVLLKSTR